MNSIQNYQIDVVLQKPDVVPAQPAKNLGEIIGESLQKSTRAIDLQRELFSSTLSKGIWYRNEYIAHHGELTEELLKASKGLIDSEYFDTLAPYNYQLKEGKSASQAIHTLFTGGPFVLECGIVMDLCVYKAILDCIGEEKFDCLFSNGKQRLFLGTNHKSSRSPLKYFIEKTEGGLYKNRGVVGNRPLKKGDLCYFENVSVEEYHKKHPAGAARGWNVICVDDTPHHQLFWGLGFEKPLTEREICKFLIAEYQKPPTPLDLHYFDEEKMPIPSLEKADLTLQRKAERHVGGFREDTPRQLCHDVLSYLIKTPATEISMEAIEKNFLPEEIDFFSLKRIEQCNGEQQSGCGICEKVTYIRDITIGWPASNTKMAHKYCFEKIKPLEQQLLSIIAPYSSRKGNVMHREVVRHVKDHCGGLTLKRYLKKHGEDSLKALFSKAVKELQVEKYLNQNKCSDKHDPQFCCLSCMNFAFIPPKITPAPTWRTNNLTQAITEAAASEVHKRLIPELLESGYRTYLEYKFSLTNFLYAGACKIASPYTESSFLTGP